MCGKETAKTIDYKKKNGGATRGKRDYRRSEPGDTSFHGEVKRGYERRPPIYRQKKKKDSAFHAEGGRGGRWVEKESKKKRKERVLLIPIKRGLRKSTNGNNREGR